MDIVSPERPDLTDEELQAPETPEVRAARIIQAARECVQQVEEAEKDDRHEAEIDLDFKAGEQWPDAIVQERQRPGQERPCLTFNEIFPVVKQITNDFLQNPPGLLVHPVDDQADPKTAEVIAGMLRHIAYTSSGQAADEVAFESAVDIGKGYLHIRTQYVDEASFQQEIILDALPDTFCVYFDAHSTAKDGSDAKRCVILDRMRRADFTRAHPEAEATNVRLAGDVQYGDWLQRDVVYVAHYYCLEYETDVLYQLRSGQAVWQSALEDPRIAALAGQIGFHPTQVREVQRPRLKYYLLTAVDLLEERELPGKWLPVVPFYGNVIVKNGVVRTFGVIRSLRDPQQMENYAETTKAELVGLQPRAPWVGPEGFMGPVGTEQWHAWQQSNTSNVVGLEYARTGLDGLPITEPPLRQPFPTVPMALVEMREAAMQYIQRLSGIRQPADVAPSSNRSRVSLREQDSQSSMANYHYMNNARHSMLHVGRICLSWFPTYYTTEQVVRILGEDGQARTARVNQRVVAQTPQGQAITRVLNDLQTGHYDVRLATGPAYQTKREEAGDKIVQLAAAGWPKILDVAGSDVIRALEMPGGDKIAAKLALTEPQLPGEDVDAEQALPQVLAQLQKVQQEAQALKALADQLDQQARDLTEQNRELRIGATGQQAQLQAQRADATAEKQQMQLQLEELKLQRVQDAVQHSAQVARLQAQLAQQQLATAQARNGAGDHDGSE